MPAVFTGRWCRGTIINQALQRVGNLKIRDLARDRLNRVLEELYTQWEWPFLYKVFSFTFPNGNTGGQLGIYGSQVLPSDFLKTEQETTGLRIITQNGNTVDFPVVEVDPVQFRRRAIPHDLTGSRPLIYYVSYGEQFIYFWPAPDGTISNASQLIYKFLVAEMPLGVSAGLTTGTYRSLWSASTPYFVGDVVTASDGLNYQASAPTTNVNPTGNGNPASWAQGVPGSALAYDLDAPLFPWSGYLSMEVEWWALQYDRDPNAQAARSDCDRAFDRIRNIAMPRGSQESGLPLDPTMFGPGFRDESSRYFRDWDWWST